MLYFTGDLHSEILDRISKVLRSGVNRDEVNAMLVCGDFGCLWSPEDQEYEQSVLDDAEKMLVDCNMTLFFCDGNHENYDLLYSIPIAEDGTRHIPELPE